MFFKKPKFWDQSKFSLLSFLLLPLTFPLVLNNWILNSSSKKKYNIKTICIGNIYVGGTGKTPLSIEINLIAKKLKFKTVFIKKFYRSQIDERKLLKKNGTLISESSREKSLDKSIKNKFSLAILDDGLQDKSINYDLKFVCFNSDIFCGNGRLIPAGPMRESISSLKKYNVVFLNGISNPSPHLYSIIRKKNKNIQIFKSSYVPTNLKKIKKTNKYLIFSGIGNSKSFEIMLKKYNYKILKSLEYPDHYKYSFSDIKKIKLLAKKINAKILTTEKDYLRLNKSDRQNIDYVKVELKIFNKSKLIKFIKKNL